MVVGSDQRAVAAAMRDATPLPVAVGLRREAAQLIATIGTPPTGATVSLAVYDAERVTEVRAGENGGRKLREFHIVRELRLLDGMTGTVTLPGIGADQGAVLLLRDEAGRIAGAADAKPMKV